MSVETHLVYNAAIITFKLNLILSCLPKYMACIPLNVNPVDKVYLPNSCWSAINVGGFGLWGEPFDVPNY